MRDVAVVGSGYWGRNLVRNFAELGRLKWICDKNSHVLETFQKIIPRSIPVSSSLMCCMIRK